LAADERFRDHDQGVILDRCVALRAFRVSLRPFGVGLRSVGRADGRRAWPKAPCDGRALGNS
jgi:hypothetical protein